MVRRYQYVNVPTEIVRSVACIVELGSFTKAAERLGITQPAISAQIKRLQVMVGGAIFERTAGGVGLSERGKLLLPLIRRFLEANDQILQLGCAAQDPRPVRVGISSFFAELFLTTTDPALLRTLNILCDNSSDLSRGLAEGHVDIAAFMQPPRDVGTIRMQWKENIVWVRSSGFTLSPGSPVPIVGWPGILLDQLAIRTLETKGIAYRLAFSSYEPSARIAAVKAGLGVMLLPSWLVPDDVVVAREYYLPPIPDVEAGIVTAHGIEDESISDTLDALIRYNKSER